MMAMLLVTDIAVSPRPVGERSVAGYVPFGRSVSSGCSGLPHQPVESFSQNLVRSFLFSCHQQETL